MSTEKELTGVQRTIAAFKKQERGAASATPSTAAADPNRYSPAMTKTIEAMRKQSGETAPTRTVSRPLEDPSKLTGLARTVAAFRRDEAAKNWTPAAALENAPNIRPATQPQSTPGFTATAHAGKSTLFSKDWYNITASAGTKWTPAAIRALIRSGMLADWCAANDALQELGPRFPEAHSLLNELVDAVLPGKPALRAA